MIRLLAALMLCASNAAALSCVPPDVVRAYRAADADTARWGAVIGRLDFDMRRLPQTDWKAQDQTPPETEIPAQLVGHALGQDGWTDIYQRNVTLRVQCFGPWCAAPQSAQTYLAFVRLEAGRQVVIADPCGVWLFPTPGQAERDRLHACFTGGPCALRSQP